MDKVDLSSADPDEKEMSWGTVSSLARDQRDRDVNVDDESKTVLDWIKEGDVERVRQVCPLMHCIYALFLSLKTTKVLFD